MKTSITALLLTLSLAIPAMAQSKGWWGARKRPMTTADYGKFERLGSPVLSPDGKFLAATIRRTDGSQEVQLYALGEDGEPKTYEQATSPRFSDDGKWLCLRVQVAPAKAEKLRASKKTPQDELRIVHLEDGESEDFADVASFAFSDDGRYLAMRRYAPKDNGKRGVDLVVRDMTTSRDTSFGNVASYSWHDKRSLLAIVIDTSDDRGNGVQLFDCEKAVLQTLDSEKAKYTALTWREDHDDLAVMREMEHGKTEDASHVILYWHALTSDAVRDGEFDHRELKGFPDMRVVTGSSLRWSEDGRGLFFGIKAWQDKPKGFGKKKSKSESAAKKAKKESSLASAEKKPPAKKSESKSSGAKVGKGLRGNLTEQAGVEVWHTKDIDIIPLQKKRMSREKRKSYLAVWWVDTKKFVQLGDETSESVRLLEQQHAALGLDNTPHETDRRFGPTLYDVKLIDTRTGERQPILEHQKFLLGSSPNGNFALYQKQGQVWSIDIASGAMADLTSKFGTAVVNSERKVLTDESPIYGFGGWAVDSSAVYIYDRFDVWRCSPDGSVAERLTDGAESQTRFRMVDLDRDEDHIDPSAPMFFSVYGHTTKKSGYARLGADGKLKKIVWQDKAVGRLQKAGKADLYSFVSEGYDDSPDVFVSDGSFASPVQVTESNAFQKKLNWGRSELVDFESDHGVKLQGALYYPAGYEPGKRYPMITYIYEMRSQNLHRYSTPSERSPYNPAVFTSKGYFVFQPDIVYRAQFPGPSALECVVPAVKKVLESGMIDPKRVGIVGHSWGAYQTAFLVTHSDVFAAGIAGAPLTNMMSMSMSIYWNSGQTDAWIFHESQGRMDKPFWQDVDTYIANSPIFGVDNLNTPLLIAFGDEDGAVDWHQGIEMFNAARLAQKPLVMLVYAKENHSLRKKANQVDYHHRILEWFGHYLQGEKAETWISEGTPHLDRVRELELKRRKKGGKPSLIELGR